MSTKISVIIPFYPVDEEKHTVLQACVTSLPQHHETIVVWNRREGYAKAINEGAKCASGDYLLIMNDDVTYLNGNIAELCQEDTIVSPSYNGQLYPFLWGSCFCIPKKVWDDIGGMDERYTISYFDDDDLILTLQEKEYQMRSTARVVFDHPQPGRTLEAMPNRDEFFKANKQRFLDKWGRLP